MANLERFYGESSVRFADYNGERLVCANDCASILEYRNPRQTIAQFVEANNELLTGMRGVYKLYTPTKSGTQEQWYFSEKGLIAFLIKSNKEKAIPFQKWAIEQLHAAIKNSRPVVDKTLRVKSKKVRCEFTDTLQNHGVTKPYEFIQLTYQTKIGLGIEKNKKKNDCNLMELCQIAMTELLSTYEIEARELNGYHEIKPTVLDSSGIVKQIPLSTIEKAIE